MAEPARWHAVLFDLDGTLVDTAADFHSALAALCAREGQATPDAAAIRSAVSDGARALVRLAFGDALDDARVERLREKLLARYAECLTQDSRPFPGIRELLGRLDEVRLPWGVVTNKPRRYARPLLASLALRPQALVCPEDVPRAKPHPEPLWLACKQLARPPHRSVYIGDHRRDMEAARNAGLTAIAACYGYLHPDDAVDAWPADHRVDSAEALWPLISRRITEPVETC